MVRYGVTTHQILKRSDVAAVRDEQLQAAFAIEVKELQCIALLCALQQLQDGEHTSEFRCANLNAQWLRFRCFAEIWWSNVRPGSRAQISGSLRQTGESTDAWRMTKGVLLCNTPIFTPA